MKNQRVIDTLNSLEVVEKQGGEDAYILVANNDRNQKVLKQVGIGADTINKYGDEKTFCVLALAFNEGYANWIEEGKPVHKDATTANHLKNEIKFILDLPLTDFPVLHDTIQDVLNQY